MGEFFSHENQVCPPSLSENGHLNTGTKAALLECLKQLSEPLNTDPKCESVTIDGMVMLNFFVPKRAIQTTFEDYTQNSVIPYLEQSLKTAERLDVVNDTYHKNSLKKHTRDRRGTGVRLHKIHNRTKLPRDWKSFLRNDTNKSELISYLSNAVLSGMSKGGKLTVFTSGDHVRSVPEKYHLSLDPCNQEEADTRIFLHIADAAQVHKTCLIRTNDTDVLVLAIAFASKMNLQIFISFGKLCYDALDIATKLGSDRCRAFMLFHAFTGSDTTSFFRSKGKKICWAAWEQFHELTPIFIKLTESETSPTESDLRTLERFVCILYDQNSDISKVNDLRQHLFASKMRLVENIPPTERALKYNLL